MFFYLHVLCNYSRYNYLSIINSYNTQLSNECLIFQYVIEIFCSQNILI